jgi:hypothetical protein
MHRLPVIIVLLCLLVSCGSQEEQAVKPMYKPTDTTLLEFEPLSRPEKYGWTWIYKKPVRLSKYKPVFVRSWDGFPGDSLYIHSDDPIQTLNYYRYCEEFFIYHNYCTGVFRLNENTYGFVNSGEATTFYRLESDQFREIQKIKNPIGLMFTSPLRYDFNHDGRTELEMHFYQLTEPIFVHKYYFIFNKDEIAVVNGGII